MKYCMSCMSRIPLLASRCPNCIDNHQGVLGRVILVLMLIAGMFIGAKYYLYKKGDTRHRALIENQNKKGDVDHKELIEKLNELGI